MILSGSEAQVRPGLLIVVGEEAVDRGLEVNDAFEDPALEATLGEDGEEASTALSQEALVG